MSVTTFVMNPEDEKTDDRIFYSCMECQNRVPANESDSHAIRTHKSAMIRVFASHGAYQDFLHEEKIRAARKEMS